MSYNYYPETTEEKPARPSFSVQTEITILGACLLDAVAIQDAIGKLRAEDFSLDSHMRIFRCVVDMLRAGKAVDYITVMDALTKRGELDSIGGPAYLAFLTEGIPRNPKIEDYVRIVKEASVARSFMAILNNGMLDMNDGEEPALVRERVQGELARLSEGSTDSPLTPAGDYVDQEYGRPERLFEREYGVPSGFGWFDNKTNGFVPGDLIIVAARPSMGKTAWMTSLIINIAIKRGEPMAVFSLEQSKQQIMQRLVCGRAGISLAELRGGRLSDEHQRYAQEALGEIRQAPIYWDDSSGMTVSKLRAKTKRLNRELRKTDSRLVLSVTDQLSSIDISEYYKPGRNTADQIGFAVADLKKLGKEEGIPQILLCQLNRTSTKNPDKRPLLADLADSGKIEQHADVVKFLHREWYYDKSDASKKNKGHHIIAKQRQGPVGEHEVIYSGPMCRWSDSWTAGDTDEEEDYYLPIPNAQTPPVDDKWMGNR